MYDCLFPWTIGGAERWYRALAERLAAEGHQLTYLTLRQWDRDCPPRIPGVQVIAVGPRFDLYTRGRRRVMPPLIFGGGVLRHLLLHGRDYDVVHSASFPYFSVLAAAATRPFGRFRLVIDWWEVWTRDAWQAYIGGLGGRLGWAIQRLCVAVPHQPLVFSRLHGDRLVAAGIRQPPLRLGGLYAGPAAPATAAPPRPVVVYAGRHIPEKQVPAIIPAVALARQHITELSATIIGDGPDRGTVRELAMTLGLADVIRLPGFVDDAWRAAAMRDALCLILPSRREGFGLVIVEAAVTGTPSIVVAGPDNAAAELVKDGVNGFVAPSASAEDLASAILRVHQAGMALRESTASWFQTQASRLTLSHSLDAVLATYQRPTPGTLAHPAVECAGPAAVSSPTHQGQ